MDNLSSQLSLNRLPKNTFEITAEINFNAIEKTQNKILEDTGKEIEIKGFRKGMAPAKLIREEIGEKKLLEETLEKILPDIFQKAVTNLNLKPIVSPRVELLSAKEKENWKIKFTSCEEPLVKLDSYKENLKKVLLASLGRSGPAADKIWTPDKTVTSENDKNKREERINTAIKWLLDNIEAEISDLLLEEEINRKLSNLLEQTQKLGLTIEQYLSSTQKTINQLKEEYKKQSNESLKLEFILEKIAEEEKITVTEEDISKAISAAEKEEEKKALNSQKYYLAIVLKRKKTLDFLAAL